MLQNLYYPVFAWRKLPPVLCLSLGGLLGLLLAAFVVGKRAEQQTTQLFAEYGNSLAYLTAQRAVDSAIKRDLLALHALLQDVVVQERVLFATISDVDGSLLVQAGDPFWPGKHAEFSAAIALQDNSAGSVTVGLTQVFQGEQAVTWAITGTALLLLLMAALALYESYDEAWWLVRRRLPRRQPKPPPGLDAIEHEPDEHDESFAPAQPYPAEHAARCVLTLSALNAKALEQTISGSLFEAVVAEFDQKLSHVVSLYGGKITDHGPPVQGKRVEFYADERTSEALFQSVCAAHLLNALLQDRKFRFRLNAYASVNGNVGVIKREGIFCENVETSEFLSARLDVEEIETNIFWVRGLKAPFSDLVLQQLQRLKAAESS